MTTDPVNHPPHYTSHPSGVECIEVAEQITNSAKGIKGERVGGQPDNEAEDFYTCAACGQSVYMGDLGQVFHHEVPGHSPHMVDA